MFTAEAFFVIAMQQRYGVTDLAVTTLPRHSYSYIDEQHKLITVAKPVLVFGYKNVRVEKAMPMVLQAEWVTGSAGVAMQRVFAVCDWTADDIEAYISKTVADLRDNDLVKG